MSPPWMEALSVHDSVFKWVRDQVALLGLHSVAPVLEVGSYNVNGSVRPHFHQANYTGVDIVAGPGVDIVVGSTQLPFAADHFEVVVSTEMLEHAEHPEPVMKEMFRVLRPGGILSLTARSEGFPYHNPPDYHRFSVGELSDLLRRVGFVRFHVAPDPGPPGVFAVAHKL